MTQAVHDTLIANNFGHLYTRVRGIPEYQHNGKGIRQWMMPRPPTLLGIRNQFNRWGGLQPDAPQF
eukprot:1158313-Pelagomonas_calceolata.AAC.6